MASMECLSLLCVLFRKYCTILAPNTRHPFQSESLIFHYDIDVFDDIIKKVLKKKNS